MPASRSKPRIAVILMNLGTPDQPTPAAVRRYLRQFLSDSRVIEIPKLLWLLILNLLVLPFRPKRVAKAYASIWQDGDSPMRLILQQQTRLLEQHLQPLYPQAELSVHAAMTYGNPATATVLDRLQQQQVEHMIVLPLFPQYSATSTGAAFDAVTHWMQRRRDLPSICLIKDYYQHPLFIEALAQQVRNYQNRHGQAEKLLLSFHGIPQPYADKGDPYAVRCDVTARLLADALQLKPEQWAISFQSRFGRQEWVKPYTSELLAQWAQQGVNSVQVMSPAFSADCLETLEELAIENRDIFLQAGGQHYAYIPALNTEPLHIELFAALTKPLIDGFLAAAYPAAEACV
ncbi:ferrochelatase [Alkanindiges sp. WGS2144]|uniref:ferrochelatase n=1 Tax=Alkanindiges sp. WGS2144 TaxID=3366808 RepID=UPI003752E336